MCTRRTMLNFLTCAISGAAMPVSQALLAYFEESDATRTDQRNRQRCEIVRAQCGAGHRYQRARARFRRWPHAGLRASVGRNFSGGDVGSPAACEQRTGNRDGGRVRLRRHVPDCCRNASRIGAARLSQHGARRRVRCRGGRVESAETGRGADFERIGAGRQFLGRHPRVSRRRRRDQAHPSGQGSARWRGLRRNSRSAESRARPRCSKAATGFSRRMRRRTSKWARLFEGLGQRYEINARLSQTLSVLPPLSRGDRRHQGAAARAWFQGE